jgi:hypothetical protein
MTTGRINQVTLVKGIHHELEKKKSSSPWQFLYITTTKQSQVVDPEEFFVEQVLYKHCIASTLSQFSELLKIRSISIAELHPIASLFFFLLPDIENRGFSKP